MLPKILLINPPIHDFSAYDFWLKPYGLLRVGGYLRRKARLHLFDYLDRLHPAVKGRLRSAAVKSRLAGSSDDWGRGPFYSERIPKPALFSAVPRHYRRFGVPREYFQRYLMQNGPFDFALVQTVMTYWYPGVREVIEDIRIHSPLTQIVLGGVYATICSHHARTLDADWVVEGLELESLWKFLKLEPDFDELPFWDGYEDLEVGILKLAEGCPFRCTYCSVPQVYPKFRAGNLEYSLRELRFLQRRGVQNIAFYDDALLYLAPKILLPFLEKAVEEGQEIHFHTPNALNARFITRDTAHKMVHAGFKTFYLGFESDSYEWQKKTGGKVYSEELIRAVENLTEAGARLENITAYLIVGHPSGGHQRLEASMRFAHSLGIRLMLSEFSPIPGTSDGEATRPWLDLDEPLRHNKTAFAYLFLGANEVHRLKNIRNELNRALRAGHT